MDLAFLGLTVDNKGAIRALNVFTGSAHNASYAAGNLEKSTKAVTRAFGGLAAYLSARSLIQYADTWTLINSRINTVTDTQEEARAIQQRLYEISQRTRNSMAATSVLYTRLAQNSENLNVTHNDLLKVTESVNAAMLISGATGVEAAQSMRQLAQALGSGRVQGDEFRTMMEAMPEVAKAVAEEFGVARGELYKLSKEGKISVDRVIKALIDQHDRLVEEADKMPVTVEQSMVIFVNGLERMVGILNMGIGVTGVMAKAMIGLTNNLDKAAAAVFAVIGAYVAYRTALLAVAAWQKVVTAYQTIQAFLSLARSIRSVADATALWSMVSKGVLGVVAGVAALAGGFIAYRTILSQIEKATEEWEKAQADLNKQLGEAPNPVDEEALRMLKRAKEEAADMIRIARQQLAITELLNERDQERMQIAFDAENALIEARREYSGEALAIMEAAIRTTMQFRLDQEALAYEIEQAMEKLEAQRRAMESFAQNIQKSFADAFADIFEKGFRTFRDLWVAVKKLFFRALAEMMSADITRRFASTLAGGLAGILGLSQGAMGQVPSRTEGLSPETLAAMASVYSGDHLVTHKPPDGTTQVELVGMAQKVERSFGQTLLSALGPALAGFGVGSMIGGMTTNRVLGTLGGALSGAATGAAIGSLIPGIGTFIGGAIGGLTGAIGGLLGSNERHRQELERHRLVLQTNNERIKALKDEIQGSTLGSDLVNLLGVVDRLLKGGQTLDEFVAMRYNGRWTTRGDLIAAAEKYGFALDNSRKSLEQFREGLRLMGIALTQFGNNLRDAEMKIEAYNKLFDVEQTPMQALQDSLSILSQMAPELVQRMGLGNLNLTTEEGRQAALEGLRGIYELIASGQLTPELLGAFTDKNQLLDAILRVKDALDLFHEQLYNVTTDFPRAMDIIYYEQKFGRYGMSPRPDVASHPNGGFIIHGGVTIVNEAGDSPEDMLNKLEAAAYAKRSRGGNVLIQ